STSPHTSASAGGSCPARKSEPQADPDPEAPPLVVPAEEVLEGSEGAGPEPPALAVGVPPLPAPAVPPLPAPAAPASRASAARPWAKRPLSSETSVEVASQ